MRSKLPKLSTAIIKANTCYFCDQGFEPRETLPQVKGWLADDAEKKTIYPISPRIARQSVAIGAMGADGEIRYGEQNTYQDSAFVIMEHKETGLRWIKKLY